MQIFNYITSINKKVKDTGLFAHKDIHQCSGITAFTLYI
jgi:hypothetical protein